ncbi:MAG: DUF5615 family PIN-like protein [Segetibacter sp.]
MKLIVDAQLPQTLSVFLVRKGFDSIHTLQLSDKNNTKDKQIIEIPTEQKRVVITKDYDFLESFITTGKPPKLILVKTGNISNKELLKILEQQLAAIINALNENGLIELHANKIIIHSSL